MSENPPELNSNLSIHDNTSSQYYFPGQQPSPQSYSEHDKHLSISNRGSTAVAFTPELDFGHTSTAHADHFQQAAGWAVQDITMQESHSSFMDHHSMMLAARTAIGSPINADTTSHFTPLGSRSLDRALAPPALPSISTDSAVASNQKHGHVFAMRHFENDGKEGESALVEVSVHEDQSSMRATVQPQKSRASKKQKQTKVVETTSEVQREVKLERNRQAASRCRTKKKEWADQLEERLRTLSNEHARLTMHNNILRDQVIQLKTMLLQHCNCRCERTREYLKDSLQ